MHLIASLLIPWTAVAHHSVPANFDMQTDIDLSGTIASINWQSPHSRITMKVITDIGETEIWLVEMNAVNTIRRLGKRLGWSTVDFVVGEKLTVGGWLGRHDRSIYFRRATLASGLEIIWESGLDPDLTRLE